MRWNCNTISLFTLSNPGAVLLSWAQKEHPPRGFISFATSFPVFLKTTCISLCLLRFGPLSLMILIFAWLSVYFCLFLLSFRLLFTDIQSYNSVTPLSALLQTNSAYFPWHVSVPVFLGTSESRLCYFTIFKWRDFNCIHVWKEWKLAKKPRWIQWPWWLPARWHHACWQLHSTFS